MRDQQPLNHVFVPDFNGEDRCALIIEGWTWTISDPIRCRRPAAEHPKSSPVSDQQERVT